MSTTRALSVPALIIGALVMPASAETRSIPDEWRDALEWRSIGPANMGGRITDVAVYEDDPCIWWAATASGGLVKTINNGVTFEHQFDREATSSVGDVAVCQSDPNIVWVGTGESNPRNSVTWGDGVYKSTDGGATWTHKGLRDSFQIGRIMIHPDEPDIVFVGALGRLWGPNEERGLFRTTDGGDTWEKVLYIGEHTGVIDVQMHPEDPDTLLVATYERERDGFDANDPAKKWGPGSGIYRTTDGGDTFEKITEGLPTGALGRIGLDYYRADPDVVYAIVESEQIGHQPEDAPYMGISGADADVGARLTEITEDGPAAAAELKAGDIIIRMDDAIVHSYDDFVRQMRHHLAGDTIEIEVSRDRKSVVLEVTFGKRPGTEEDQEEEEDEAAAARRRLRNSPFRAMLGGQRSNAQDEQGPDGYEYGGVFRSADGGVTWERVNSINPRPMYFSQIRVNPSDENNVYVLGVSLHRSSDGGTTFTSDGGRGVHPDHHAMWIDPNDGRHIILGCDGGIYVTYDRMERWDHLNHVAIGQFYHVTVDSRANYRVYGGLQDNGTWGGPCRVRDGRGPINEDWVRVGGGDGFVCRTDEEDPDQIYFESQNGGIGRMNLRTGDRGFLRPRAARGTRYRFNWKTPFILSNHNSRIYYTAGNHVFRSLDRGNGLRTISPEITRTDRGSATALGESVRDADVLYVGTDDGALWMTRDGGHEWTDLFAITRESLAAEAAAEAAAKRKAEEETEAKRKAEAAAKEEADDAPPPERAASDAPGDRAPAEGGRRRGGPGRMLAMLERADANGDGRLQKSEVPERMMRFFDRADANDDGALDKAELEAAAARRRGTGADPSEPRGSDDVDDDAKAGADPVSGIWAGRASAPNAPADQSVFELFLRLDPDGETVTGRFASDRNDGPITGGTFDRASGKFRFEFDGAQMSFAFAARIEDGRMKGDVEIGDGLFTMKLDATRKSDAPPPDEAPAVASADDADSAPIAELLPGPRWVSSLEPSRFVTGRVYATFDGHRSDDLTAYAFVSENNGKTWRSLLDTFPAATGSARVLREDRTDADILYLGTEFAAWVSIDRGASWTSLNTNLPTVAVHEIAQHPTCGEIVAGTHGRSLWILDVTALRQMKSTPATVGATLFAPDDVHYWRLMPSRGGGLRRFVGANPPSGAPIYYAIGSDARDVSMQVRDAAGKVIRTLEPDAEVGMHRLTWDLRGDPPRDRPANRRRRGGPRVPPGTYTVVLELDGAEHTAPLHVKGDPEYPDAQLWGEAYEQMLDAMEAAGVADR